MESMGFKLLSSIVDSGDKAIDVFMKLDLFPDLFSANEIDTYNYLSEHLQKHGSVPSKETIEAETGEELPKSSEPPSYYMDHVERRYIQRSLKSGFLEAQELLKKKEPFQALSNVEDLVLKLKTQRHRAQIVDYSSEGYDIMHKDLTAKWKNDENFGILSGWPTLDAMTHGFLGGDFIALAGRPASGKTYKTLYMATQAWKAGKIPLVVSMEMKPLPLIQRLTALHTSIPAAHFKSGELSSAWKAKTFNSLKSFSENYPPFWIIDGNLAASVQDIMLLSRQLKPDVVFVDGAYLLQNKERSAKWERISATAEALKQQVASDLDIPCVASYQFNREQTKMNPGETGLQHIAGTDVIGQIASIVLGFFDDDTPESILQQNVDIMKGRSGEVGSFPINWKFEHYPYMDFSELVEQKVTDLQFV